MQGTQTTEELANDIATIKHLLDKHSLSLQALELLLRHEQGIRVPVSIFRAKIGPLAALCIFLRRKGMRFSEIAKLLNRDQRTIWVTHNNAKGTRIQTDGKLTVPVRIFSNRKLSIMENLVFYLMTAHSLRLIDIARLLGRSNKTVWCFYHRALKKNG